MTRLREQFYQERTVIDEHAVNVREAVRTREGRATLREYYGRTDIEDSSTRRFIAWDGEGINLDGPDFAQSYCLFGASVGISLTCPTGLSSKQCFQLLLRVKHRYPHGIMVGFSTGYDCEMMFRDVPPHIVTALMDGKTRWWGRYRLKYVNKKWLDLKGPYRGKQVSVRLYDVWSYFGCAFVDAIKKFLPDTPDEIFRRIEEGKKRRGSFTVEELDSDVLAYWMDELSVLEKLVTKLRTLLAQAGLYPTAWHGPATLANYLNKKHGVKAHMNRDYPGVVQDALQFAYAAGRVENFMVGRLGHPAWKHDRNSAYPSAMVHLPSLSNAMWRGFTFEDWMDRCSSDYRHYGIRDYALYYVDYEHSGHMGVEFAHRLPHPFFHRTKQANIQFPTSTRRWVWGVELKEALWENDYAVDRPPIRIYRGIELTEYSDERPYAFVADMYQQRLDLKARGEECEVCVKLGLNSLYGKMAQQRGWREGEPLPPWHQLDWAGFVTAHNRAAMYQAALLAAQRGILISIETDAIFTTEPMVELGPDTKELGGWGIEKFEDIVYLQSGVYMYSKGGKWTLKYRGFDRDSVKPEGVLKYLETTSLRHFAAEDYERQALLGSTTRFVGFKLANTRVGGVESDWRVWKTEPREIVVGNSGKRMHIPWYCRACQSGEYFGSDAMHDMSVKLYEDQAPASYAMKLPWRSVGELQADEWKPDGENDFYIDGIESDEGVEVF